jgi:OOP family OmpA-OmpF porin
MRYFQFALVRKCWPGLIPLVVLIAAAASYDTVPVERTLTERVTAALATLPLSKTKVEVAGRDARLSASVFSEDGRAAAVAAVEGARGIRLVKDGTQLVPEFNPYTWLIRRDSARMTLEGAVPLPAVRTALVEAARAAGGVEVADQMEFGRGAPPKFEAAAKLIIEQFAALKTGEVKITDTSISLVGTTRELGGREGIIAALKGLPEGFVLASRTITAPPYVFQAVKDPVAGTLALTGNVPDDNMRRALIAATARKFFGEKIVDNLKISIGAPQNFAAAVATALGRLSRLSTGSLVISDRTVRLVGDAFYAAAATQIRTEAPNDWPQGWRGEFEISIKPPAASVDPSVCQQLFSEVLGKTKIRFDSGSATIDADSLGLLDHLVATAMRCQSANIMVAGHTDADGDDQSNLALSERRAKAVADFLIKGGVSAERLKPLGFGRMQPIAPNDTEEGKARNRRIEFRVE